MPGPRDGDDGNIALARNSDVVASGEIGDAFCGGDFIRTRGIAGTNNDFVSGECKTPGKSTALFARTADNTDGKILN
ncbi:unannotated protein [freshwater metagenome]|uniref:Unannotated protein n=1 Tax=freshwater metagenome TaxID=449393 RepID=A0A6J7BBD2_9ZZZZ